MKKTVLVVLALTVLAVVSLYADPGDVHVEGKLGVGTTTPNAKIETTGDIKIGNTDDVCDENKKGSIKFNGITFYACAQNEWKMITLGELELDLVNGLHSSSQCADLGGIPITSGTNKFCKFSGSSCNFNGPSCTCPSGWIPYGNWSSTSDVTCQDTCEEDGSTCGWTSEYVCNTGSHSFSNSGLESCTVKGCRWLAGGEGDYCTTCGFLNPCPSKTCYATVTEVGCY